MATKRLATLAVLILCGLLLNSRVAGEPATSRLDQKAQAIVEAAHAFVSENAHDMKTVQEALESDPRFRDDEDHLYIFMHTCNIERKEAICVGQGIKPDLIGKNMWFLRTPKGRLIFQEFAELIQIHDEFWLEYEWLDPYTKTIATKRSFFKKIALPDASDAWIGCGFWKRSATGNTQPSAVVQANEPVMETVRSLPAGHTHGTKAIHGDLEDDPRFRRHCAVGETEQSPLAREVKAIVLAAHAFASEYAQEPSTIQNALEHDPRFRDDENDLYIFMHAYNVDRKEAICVGQGAKPELIGKNMWSLRTPTGRLVFQEFTELIQKHDEFWLEYEWLNPHTKTIETKCSFFKRIALPSAPNAWIGCGYWKRG